MLTLCLRCSVGGCDSLKDFFSGQRQMTVDRMFFMWYLLIFCYFYLDFDACVGVKWSGYVCDEEQRKMWGKYHPCILRYITGWPQGSADMWAIYFRVVHVSSMVGLMSLNKCSKAVQTSLKGCTSLAEIEALLTTFEEWVHFANLWKFYMCLFKAKI